MEGYDGSAPYELEQQLRVIEEFLRFLIHIVAERHILSGKSVRELIRRDVIHSIIKPTSYSGIEKKIPRRLAQSTDLNSAVSECSTYIESKDIYKMRTYLIKDELVDDIDLHFIHYHCQDYEFLKAHLTERLEARAKNQGKESYIPQVRLPKLIPINEGIFKTLQFILHTQFACQIIFYLLLNTISCNPDHIIFYEQIIDETLQLILIALEDAKNPYVLSSLGIVNDIRGGLWYNSYALKLGKGSNLLEVLVTLCHKDSMNRWKPQLEYILDRLREGGQYIEDEINCQFALSAQNNKQEDEEERKKRLAKDQQAQVIAQLKNQQKSFFDKFGKELDDIIDSSKSSSKHLWSTNNYDCITCHEPCDSSAPFGLFGLIQPSRLARNAPMQYADTALKIITENPSLDTELSTSPHNWPSGRYRDSKNHELTSSEIAHKDTIPPDYIIDGGKAVGAIGKFGGFPPHYQSRGMYASTCNHAIHLKCFQKYSEEVNTRYANQPEIPHAESLARHEYLCPFCRNISNFLIPVIPGSPIHDPLTKVKNLMIQDDDTETAQYEAWLSDEWESFCNDIHACVSNPVVDSGSNNIFTSSNPTGETALFQNLADYKTIYESLKKYFDECRDDKKIGQMHPNHFHHLLQPSTSRSYPSQEQPTSEEAVESLFSQDLEALYSYTLACIETSYRGSKPVQEFASDDPRKILSGTWIDCLTQKQCILLYIIADGASANYKRSRISREKAVLIISVRPLLH